MSDWTTSGICTPSVQQRPVRCRGWKTIRSTGHAAESLRRTEAARKKKQHRDPPTSLGVLFLPLYSDMLLWDSVRNVNTGRMSAEGLCPIESTNQFCDPNKMDARHVPKDCDMVVFGPNGVQFVSKADSLHFKRSIYIRCPCTRGMRSCPLLLGKNNLNIHNWMDKHRETMQDWPYRVRYFCRGRCSNARPHFHPR